MSAPDEASERRALLLFEQRCEHPSSRDDMTVRESQEVCDMLARLEAAEGRARRAFPTEEDARPQPHPLPLPETVGHYRLTELIGEGGMGLVFAGQRMDGLFDHEVAIKLLHPQRFGPNAIERFTRERRMLARLDHPNIARLIDGGVTEDGWPYIIMERIAGLPLDEYVAGQRLDRRGQIILLMKICAGVQAAHAALVIHGDIKPANVLVRADGSPRLLDFGVARLADGAEWAGFEPRTAAFCAPERLDGAAPTVASDVFGLGILIRCVWTGEYAPEAGISDPDIAAIARHATAQEPRERYASVEALRLDLGRWLDGMPVSARPPHIRYLVGCFVRRHRITAAVALALVAALVGALIWAATAWQRAGARAADLAELAEYQLVDLDRRLDGLPHTMALRAELAREAQSYLDRLSSNAGATPTMRRRGADGLRRLALLQGAMDRPSLGNTALAQRSFIRALATLPPTTDRETRLLRASILIDAAHGNAGAAGPGEAAHQLAMADVTGAPPDLLSRYWLGRSEVDQWNGRFASAGMAARQARQLADRMPTGPDRALLIIQSYDLEAEAAYYAGNMREARAGYEKAVQLAQAAEHRWPIERRVRWIAAHERWSLGTTLVEGGQAANGVPLLRKAYTAAAADAAADPADHVVQRNARIYMLALGQALTRSGERASGLDMLGRSVARRWDWWQAALGDASRQRDWMIGIAALGDAMAEAGQPAQACALYAAARASVSRLVAGRKLTKLDEEASAGSLNRSWATRCLVVNKSAR